MGHPASTGRPPTPASVLTDLLALAVRWDRLFWPSWDTLFWHVSWDTVVLTLLWDILFWPCCEGRYDAILTSLQWNEVLFWPHCSEIRCYFDLTAVRWGAVLTSLQWDKMLFWPHWEVGYIILTLWVGILLFVCEILLFQKVCDAVQNVLTSIDFACDFDLHVRWDTVMWKTYF